jgi:hypothetical protein
MRLETTLYPALALSAIVSGVDALPENIKNKLRIAPEKRIFFSASLLALPFALDAIFTGKPLTAFGMGLLLLTNTSQVLKNNTLKSKTQSLKERTHQFFDENSNHINLLASALPLAQNLLEKNSDIQEYIPSIAFEIATLCSMKSLHGKTPQETKKTWSQISKSSALLGSIVSGYILLKEKKYPQALLSLNMSAMLVSATYKKYKEDTH